MTARYRRLPGTLHGVLRGSSVWMAEDHLLLVNSTRFREDYKRFHLRDVQAVAVAKAPRFHLSTRAVTLGAVWLFAFTVAAFNPYLWIAAALLVGAWLYVSAFCSCRCRIYTAVSGDELPSVYRTWTARKFLAAVEPKIAEVQGVIEGEWAEAAESRDIGPSLGVLPPQMPGALPPDGVAPTDSPRHSAPAHTVTADVFVAMLFGSGIFSFATLHAAAGAVRGMSIGFLVARILLAVAVFVQHYKGKLAGGMQKVAIAALLAIGGMYYVEQMSVGFAAGMNAANQKQPPVVQVVPVIFSGNTLVSELNGAISIVLGCVGLGIIFMAKDS